MSLDLYINSKIPIKKTGTGIYVRDNGETKEITSIEEYIKYFPNAPIENFHSNEYETCEVWSGNITHNLNIMAKHVIVQHHTLYELLWHPEDVLKDNTLYEYIHLLCMGYFDLTSHPSEYKQYNPDNSWGSYEILIKFTEDFLLNLIKAVGKYGLDIDIMASR